MSSGGRAAVPSGACEHSKHGSALVNEFPRVWNLPQNPEAGLGKLVKFFTTTNDRHAVPRVRRLPYKEGAVSSRAHALATVPLPPDQPVYSILARPMLPIPDVYYIKPMLLPHGGWPIAAAPPRLA